MFDKIAYKPGSYFGLVVLSSIAKDVAKYKEKATIENSPYYGTDIKSRFAFKLPKT